MAAQYKLTYFDIRGLAEVPRLVLAAAGQAYTDDRIPFSRNADGSFERADWDERKKSAPYGQVPILEVEGSKIAQSGSIVRFLSARLGLNGASDVEAALIDAGFEAVQDIRKNFFTSKADAAKLAEFWSTGFGASVAQLAKNVQGETFFAKSNKLSYTDIAIYYLIWVLATENKEAVDAVVAANPKIAALYTGVEKNEKIAAYLAARKVTPM